MKTLASTAKYENGQLLHLRMKLDFDDPSDWYGVGIASKNQLNYAWGDNGLYHLVIKESNFELRSGATTAADRFIRMSSTTLCEGRRVLRLKDRRGSEGDAMRVVEKSMGSALCLGWMKTLPLRKAVI